MSIFDWISLIYSSVNSYPTFLPVYNIQSLNSLFSRVPFPSLSNESSEISAAKFPPSTENIAFGPDSYTIFPNFMVKLYILGTWSKKILRPSKSYSASLLNFNCSDVRSGRSLRAKASAWFMSYMLLFPQPICFVRYVSYFRIFDGMK